MRSLLLAVLLLPGMALAGGHYVYIPTFYTIPGQKPSVDSVCVPESAAVGQTSKSVNGDTLELIELNGKSRMCAGKDKPILAHVRLTPAADFASTLRVGLPPGFTELTPTDRDRFNGVRFEAEDRKRGLHVWVKSWRRDTTANFNQWLHNVRGEQVDGNARTQSRTEELEIDGCEARRWDLISPPGKSGLLVRATTWSWIETYIKGEHELVSVEVGAKSEDLDKLREELNAIAEGIQGLRGPIDASTETPAAPVP